MSVLTARQSQAAAGSVPPHLSPEYIGDYVEYASDAVQVIPTFVLPVAGTLLALRLGLGPIGLALLLILGPPALIWIALRVLMVDPLSYVSRKYLKGRYTFLPVTGMATNLVAAAIVATTL
jgi:hypothetical protein